MARGTPLTPEQIQKAFQLFTQCGNYAEVARQLNIPEPTIRLALKRLENTDRHALNVRAYEEGIELGHERLTKFVKQADKYLDKDGLCAKDYAAAVSGLTKLMETFQDLLDHPLRNKKLREDIRLAKAVRQGKIPPAPPPPLDELRAKVLRIIAARGTVDSGGATPTQSSGSKSGQQPS